jgi:predicted outer membrane repeat protein
MTVHLAGGRETGAAERRSGGARRIPCLALAVLIFFGLGGHRAWAATITVSSLADSGPNTLRAAIAAASAGDIIKFAISGTISLTSGTLTVSVPLTIDGSTAPGYAGTPVVVLDGTSAGGGTNGLTVFATGGSVTLEALTIQKFSGHGVNASSALTLTASTVSSNQAGGVTTTGDLTATNCMFSSNNGDGGVRLIPYTPLTTATIHGCTLTSNASSGNGGAIDLEASPGAISATVSDCAFAANTASGSGGALSVHGHGGPVTGTISGCTFTSNRASNGGALQIKSDTGLTTAVVDTCTFTSNSASGTGGATFITAQAADVNAGFTSCVFRQNAAAGGGAVEETNATGRTQPTFSGCTFTSNTSSAGGGAIDLLCQGAPLGATISGGTFTDNSALTGGGAILATPSNNVPTVSLSTSTFTGNRALGAGASGGALRTAYVYAAQPILVASQCVFDSNSAPGSGGAIDGDALSPTLSACAFSGNSAARGGAIHVQNPNLSALTPSLTDCTFINDGPAIDFAGLSAANDVATLINCSFYGNAYALGASGGTAETFNVTNCILYGDTEETSSASPPSALTFSHCIAPGTLVTNGVDGNIAGVDPVYNDAAAGDLRPAAVSPAIAVGTASGAPATDLNGDAWGTPGNVPNIGALAAINVGGRAVTSTAVAASPILPAEGQTVILTATVRSLTTLSVPASGTVTFADGATTLGAVPLAGGTTATLTLTLSAGTHALTATYAGDNNYASSNGSAQVPVNPAAALTVSSTVSRGTVSPGESASFDLAFTSNGGTTPGLGNAVTFTATGLPSGATARFTPASVGLPPGVNFAGTTTLTVTLPSGAGLFGGFDHPRFTVSLLVCLVLLRFALSTRPAMRSRRRLATACGVLLVLGLAGCGGGSSGGASAGAVGAVVAGPAATPAGSPLPAVSPTPGTSAVTITATSGNFTTTTTVNVTVQ